MCKTQVVWCQTLYWVRLTILIVFYLLHIGKAPLSQLAHKHLTTVCDRIFFLAWHELSHSLCMHMRFLVASSLLKIMHAIQTRPNIYQCDPNYCNANYCNATHKHLYEYFTTFCVLTRAMHGFEDRNINRSSFLRVLCDCCSPCLM